MDISEANILITGAAQGLGQFVALNFLDKAEKIFVLDNNQELIERLPKHDKLICYYCDVTNPSNVEEVIKDIFTKHERVNVCINNAGVIHSEPLINTLSLSNKKHSLANWQKVIDVNLNAVFYVTSNVVEQMVEKRVKGVIINISSISAKGNIGQSAYAASKSGVEALAKTWSKELGIFKIRAVSIAPGFFNTPSTKRSLSEAMLNKWQKNIPLGRLGELEELFSAIKFVIENNYFNGKTLSLDGGLAI
ncbi:MAG TPA: SDR family NAD(P)-dependent oxidoreductase [Puia sp.]|nr:SDR family NAD(P)-dependent oxidoreductase [Puia sp.]